MTVTSLDNSRKSQEDGATAVILALEKQDRVFLGQNSYIVCRTMTSVFSKEYPSITRKDGTLIRKIFTI